MSRKVHTFVANPALNRKILTVLALCVKVWSGYFCSSFHWVLCTCKDSIDSEVLSWFFTLYIGTVQCELLSSHGTPEYNTFGQARLMFLLWMRSLTSSSKRMSRVLRLLAWFPEGGPGLKSHFSTAPRSLWPVLPPRSFVCPSVELTQTTALKLLQRKREYTRISWLDLRLSKTMSKTVPRFIYILYPFSPSRWLHRRLSKDWRGIALRPTVFERKWSKNICPGLGFR